MPYPSHAHCLLSYEEGLRSGMGLSGGGLTTFLDFARFPASSKGTLFLFDFQSTFD